MATSIHTSEICDGDVFRVGDSKIAYFALMTMPETEEVQGITFDGKGSIIAPWENVEIIGHAEPPSLVEWLESIASRYSVDGSVDVASENGAAGRDRTDDLSLTKGRHKRKRK